MKPLKKLNQQQRENLFKAPVYVSLLAANADGEMDEKEKIAAIQFSHMKTFSCDPLLSDFYKEVEGTFADKLEQLDNELPKGKSEREKAISKELEAMEGLLTILGSTYSKALHHSFVTYTEHVSKAHRSNLASFIFPFNIKGFTT